MSEEVSETWGGGLHSGKLYSEIISLENLFLAWNEFKKGKFKRKDVAIFSGDLEDHLFQLRTELKSDTYSHGPYRAFVVCDPKKRNIHKATVRDRVVHRAFFRILYPIFNNSFIYDSYSSRNEKSTLKANERLTSFALKELHNNTRTVYILKCDIRKFFDTIDHGVLLALLKRKIIDPQVTSVLENIIESFHVVLGKGIPLGNLTSQLFANIYMNYFDNYLKRRLRVRYYVRYADDFAIISSDKSELDGLIPRIQEFLQNKLKLDLHPCKISIRKWHQGIDFLGYVSYPRYSVLRTKTRRRIFMKIKEHIRELQNGTITRTSFIQTIESYKGILKHCNGYKLRRKIMIISRQNSYKEGLKKA